MRRVLGLPFLVEFITISGWCLDPALPVRQYAHSAWTRENGQIPASVLALTQTKDGWLWVGTDNGLLRYDGASFQSLKLSTPPGGEYILSLAPSPDGSLWIGSRYGLAQWAHGQLKTYRTSQGPAGPGVSAIAVDGAGAILAATGGYNIGQLCRVAGEGLACENGPNGYYSLLRDRRGTIWAGGVGLWHSESAASPPRLLSGSRGFYYSVVEDREGTIWAATAGGLKRIEGERVVTVSISEPQPEIAALLPDRDGGLWIATRGQGLLRLYQGHVHRFSHQDGLSGDAVNCLLEDREGNIWAGTNNGIDRFHEFPVTTLSGEGGIVRGPVGSVAAGTDGSVWAGTTKGLVRISASGTRAYTTRDHLPGNDIAGLFSEAGGRMWVFTPSGAAYWEKGEFHAPQFPPGFIIQFAAGAEDQQHTVWFSDAEHGLLRLRDARLVETIPWSEFANKRAWAILPDPSGHGLWMGFAEGGVAHYEPGAQTRWFTPPPDLDRAAVMDLASGPDNALWVATRKGFAVVRSGAMVMPEAPGLSHENVNAIVIDRSGDPWLSTGHGFTHVNGADLERWYTNPSLPVGSRTYDWTDGLRGGAHASGYFRSAVRSADGRLWFAAFQSLAVLNPARLPENRLPPPVEIENITAGDQSFHLNPDLRLKPRTKEVRIDYAAMSFVAPEKVRFRYRLDGFDSDWHDVGNSRQAVYTNLPPRRYTFRVIACNNDGLWNTAGSSYDFSIDRAYYQTSWFKAVMVALGGALLWGLFRLRLKTVKERLRIRMEERYAERTRIAGEMHDTLLQRLCGFALLLDGVSKNSALPASAQDDLRLMRDETEQCMRDAREFVWDLRAPVITERSLSDLLREAGEEITHGKAIQFHVAVSGRSRPAPANMQFHLLRIVQELLRNSVRHAQAKEIQVAIDYQDREQIHLQMRDDGRGFDIENAGKLLGHWGLTTIRERARQIGAELNIVSQPGSGTQIDIFAPLPSTSD